MVLTYNQEEGRPEKGQHMAELSHSKNSSVSLKLVARYVV